MLRGNKSYADAIIALSIGAAGMVLYLRTLAPSVATIFDDSLEFQVVCPTLRIAHPPGYPLYTLLGWLFTHIPLGDPAYRVNLLSALAGSLTLASLYLFTCCLVKHRWSSLLAPLFLSLSPVFWSQSTIAEVYTLHTLMVILSLYFALKAVREHKERYLFLSAAFTGLGLAHHRTSVFLILPLALAGWKVAKPKGRTLSLTLLALTAPLLLYGYIPLRGMSTTSLDGTYRNTPVGFIQWVTASAYGVFLRANPLAGPRPFSFYLHLWWGQFGPIGLAIGLIGLLRLIKGGFEALLWWTAFIPFTAFAAIYRVPDVEVFFLPSFVLFSSAISLGGDAISELRIPARKVLIAMSLALVIAQPLVIAVRNFHELDRSDDWDMYELGVDWLSSIPEGRATVVGILGEITLMRYFQELYRLRPDITLIPADREEERLEALEQMIAEGKVVYLTRPLSILPSLYRLWARGRLIRVWDTAPPEEPPQERIGREIVDGLVLEGYDVMVLPSLPSWPAWTLWKPEPPTYPIRVRVSLHWRVRAGHCCVSEELKFSVRLYDLQGNMKGQQDKVPVHFAYPVTRWHPGEVILDAYDFKVPEGDYTLVVIAYDPATGVEKGRVEAGPIKIR
ncbi:MAG TPA: DUF2723 domain-containing protein [Chloroflexi bacterium]|nr:DUF2723 domain-containing protein [Chloroflexota bacterium]